MGPARRPARRSLGGQGRVGRCFQYRGVWSREALYGRIGSRERADREHALQRVQSPRLEEMSPRWPLPVESARSGREATVVWRNAVSEPLLNVNYMLRVKTFAWLHRYGRYRAYTWRSGRFPVILLAACLSIYLIKPIVTGQTGDRFRMGWESTYQTGSVRRGDPAEIAVVSTDDPWVAPSQEPRRRPHEQPRPTG